MYRKFFKRFLDFFLSLLALIVLSPVLLILSIVGAIMMKGNPFFTQLRPGKNEKLFKLFKFRTMTNEKDSNGNLLPDHIRLNAYGKFLRSTSLDELPELFNILIGTMSIVGPRPLLVRDMVFMTDEQRKRHTVRQGLTGLAQVSGRNNVSWEEKFQYDLKYIEDITFWGDVKIVIKTIAKVLKREDTVRDGTVSDMDFGDYLLGKDKVTKNEYEHFQKKAIEFVEVHCERF